MMTTTKTQRPIARFWQGWLAPHKGQLIGATLLMVVVAAASASYPYLFGQIIDALTALGGRVASNGGVSAGIIAFYGPLLLVVIAIVKSIALYGSIVLTNRVALSSTTRLQQDLFAKYLSFDFTRLSGEASGAFAARFLNDVNAIREAVLRAANSFVRDLLTLIGVIGIMFWSDWQLALMTMIILPLAIGPVSAIGARVRKTAGIAQAQAGDLSGVVEESLGGARLVKTYGLEASETQRVGQALETRQKFLLHMAEQKGRVDPILEVLGGVAIAGVFLFAGYRIANGAASVGDLFAFIASLLTAAQSIRSLGGLNTVLQEGLAGLERFFAVLDEKSLLADVPDAKPLIMTHGEVEFDKVSHVWPSGAASLSNVSFTAKPGQTMALVGPSGAGKSTVLNLIPRLFDPVSGQVRIDGHNIAAVTTASLRVQLALVSQDATLFDATIAQNVAMGMPSVNRGGIQAALTAAACDFVDDLPDGMDTPVGPRGSRLSGGERQRLSLARAILRNAPILLLDEPTSALDSESEARVHEALDAFASTRTTIVVAHRLATVRRADMILVFDKGRIVEHGTHEELIEFGGLYRDLAALQFAE